MVSRALRTASVTLLVGCLTAAAVHAVENLEAGKSPSQIFAGTCTACHKSPRGLLKTVPASSLQGFLRQHYTTSSDMASVLSSFLVSNGATDTRYQTKDQPKNDLAKQRDARQDPRSEGRPDQPDRPGRRQRPAAHEASPPEADGTVAPQGGEGGRLSREARRHTRQTPDAVSPADGQTPAAAATDSKSHTKKRLGKRGKRPAEEPLKPEEGAKGDAAKDDASRDAAKPETETAKTDAGKSDAPKSDAPKSEAVKNEGDKPETSTRPASEAGETKSESAKVDAPRESSGSEPRPDLIPPSPTTSNGAPESAASPSSAPAAATPSAPPADSSPISR